MLQTELAIAECVFKRIGGRWFWGLLVATCIILYAIATMSGPDPATMLKNNRNQAFTIISLFSSVLIIVLTATELPRDMSGRIIMVLLSRPIQRYQVILGKWIGCVALGVFFISLCSLFTIGILYHAGLPLSAETCNSAIVIILRGLIIGTAGILFSTGLSEVPTMAFTVIYTGYTFTIPMISGLLANSGIPGYGKYAVSLLAYIAPNMGGGFQAPVTPLSLLLSDRTAEISATDLSGTLTSISNIRVADWMTMGYSSLYALSYTFAILGASVLLFRRRILI